jgi:protein-tyrosine phosphatase
MSTNKLKNKQSNFSISIPKVVSNSAQQLLELHNYQGPTLICNGLFIGDRDDAKNTDKLVKMGIRLVINFDNQLYNNNNFFDRELHNIETLSYDIADNSDAKISNYFETVTNSIRETIVAGKNVFVHCHMGVSRSATIVIAYLMKYGINVNEKIQMEYTNAFDYVKQIRPQINPNLGFICALIEWGKFIKFN